MGSRVWDRSASRAALVVLAIAAGAQTLTLIPAWAQDDAAPAGEARAGVAPATDGQAPVPAAAAPDELERLRAEVQRLAAAQRDLARQVEDHALRLGGQQPIAPPPEAGVSIAPFVFVLGGLAGWALSRLVQRRRDRGARSRLRL
jgi:hypothetical protein